MQHKVTFLKNQNKSKALCRTKAWCRIVTDRTKRHQIDKYESILLETIKKTVKHCKGANVSLKIGDKNVNFSWNAKDLTSEMLNAGTPVQQGVVVRPSHILDHSYAKPEILRPLNEHDEDAYEVDYSNIFDGRGKWQKRHTRGIIHIMDNFRISHEAYHELRHAGKGHFPSLTAIMKEKRKMSQEIPYIRHPTVSIFL